jgi:hypothetical protein
MSAEANGLVWLGLRRSIGSWQRLRSSLPHWRCAQLVIIDGYEQLNRAERWLVRMMVKRRNMGLLVTHHGGMQPIPTLVELQPSIDVLEQLVNHLLDRVSPEVPWRGFCTNRHLLKRLLAEEQGSVREVFMRLYDLIEDEREQLRR